MTDIGENEITFENFNELTSSFNKHFQVIANFDNTNNIDKDNLKLLMTVTPIMNDDLSVKNTFFDVNLAFRDSNAKNCVTYEELSNIEYTNNFGSIIENEEGIETIMFIIGPFIEFIRESLNAKKIILYCDEVYLEF